ncbi:MAG: prolyl oligopeptidase family serine peptidase, partial [Myxococcales bacterium]
AWMNAQDTAARKAIASLHGRDALAKRFRELFYVESVSAPTRRGERFFFMRTHADKEKAILYWKDGEKGAEKVLLDPNGWSPDGTVSLGGWNPSWDGRKLVFQKKPNAADEAILHVIDVDSGQLSEVDVIEGGKYASPSWTPDGKGFYYEWLPTDPSIKVSERPGYTELRYHALGTDPKTDTVVHPRTNNPSSFLSVNLSRDGRYLFAQIDRGWNENDVFIRDLKKDKAFRPLVLGKEARYEVEAWKDQLYIQTDEGASNQRIFKVSAAKPDRANWKELVPEDKDAALRGFAIVGEHLVLAYLKNASSELRVATLDGKPVRTIALPGIGSVNGVRGLQDQDEAYFDFSSFTQPMQVYRTSIKTGKTELWASVKVPIDPSPYQVEQVWFESKDRTRIPMFVVGRKDLKKNGENPVLLYGYGGFNVSLTPSFRASIYPWLDAGGVYVVANLRGGGEFGKAWHDAGRGSHKQNVFDDFIGAAEHLIKEGYTRPEKLAIYGGSNGGLLVGAAMTQRPDLYGAVVCAVPLLDMVRYHLFGSGRTWIPEYGTAEKEADFKVLSAYSPYQLVKDG